MHHYPLKVSGGNIVLDIVLFVPSPPLPPLPSPITVFFFFPECRIISQHFRCLDKHRCRTGEPQSDVKTPNRNENMRRKDKGSPWCLDKKQQFKAITLPPLFPFSFPARFFKDAFSAINKDGGLDNSGGGGAGDLCAAAAARRISIRRSEPTVPSVYQKQCFINFQPVKKY